MKKTSYRQVDLVKVAYTHGLDVSKARMRIHTLLWKKKHIYVGKLTFGS